MCIDRRGGFEGARKHDPAGVGLHQMQCGPVYDGHKGAIGGGNGQSAWQGGLCVEEHAGPHGGHVTGQHIWGIDAVLPCPVQPTQRHILDLGCCLCEAGVDEVLQAEHQPAGELGKAAEGQRGSERELLALEDVDCGWIAAPARYARPWRIPDCIL